MTTLSWDDLSATDPTKVSWESLSATPPPPPPRNPENYSDRFSSGVDSAKRGLMLTGMALSDQSPESMAEIISKGYRNAIGQTAAGREIEEGITPAAKNYKDSEGVGAVPAALGLAGRMAWEYAKHPTEALKQMLETVPASAPGIITGVMGSYGGAAAGAAVGGPVGSAIGGVIGGVAAGTAGSAALELGSEFEGRVIKKMIDAKLDPSNTEAMAAVIRENYQELKDKAIAKGLTTAAVDAIANRLTLGIGGMGERTLAKQARSITERVADKSLDAGQAVTDLAKVQATNAARNTMGRKVVRGAGITAGEMFGEGASEGLGRIATGDEFDAVDAIREGLLAAGQGGLMAAGGKITDKVMGMPVRSDVDAEIGRANTAIGLIQGAQTQPSTFTLPNGTTANRAEAESYVNTFPESQRSAIRAEIGIPAPTIADIGKATNVDDAIKATSASLDGIINQMREGSSIQEQQAAQVFGAENGLLASLPSLSGLPKIGTQAQELNELVASEKQNLVERGLAAAAQADSNDLAGLIASEQRDLDFRLADLQRGTLGQLPEQQQALAMASQVQAPTAFQLAMRAAQEKANPSVPTIPATLTAPAIPANADVPAAIPATPEAAPTHPNMLPGDTARNNGQPFESENGARLKLSEVVKKGGMGEVVKIGDKAFVVRPLKEAAVSNDVQNTTPSTAGNTAISNGSIQSATQATEIQAIASGVTPATEGLPAAGSGAVEGNGVVDAKHSLAAAKQELGAVQALDTPTTVLRPDGTLVIKGDPVAIRAQLSEGGVTSITPSRDGIVVGKTEAAQAKAVIDDGKIDAANVGFEQETDTQEASDALKLQDAQDSPLPVKDEALIELRKRMSVLNSLRKCLG